MSGCSSRKDHIAMHRTAIHPLWCLIAITCIAIIIVPSHTVAQSSSPGKSAGTTSAPAWYLTPPLVNDTIIARGKARSNDEQVAIDKAVVYARASLAREIDRRWRELLRAIEKESGGHLAWAPGEVVLKGSTVRDQKVINRGRAWTAYVLVALPEESARAVLLQRLHHDAQWYGKVKDTQAIRGLEQSSP
jgi:hypothetical protein